MGFYCARRFAAVSGLISFPGSSGNDQPVKRLPSVVNGEKKNCRAEHRLGLLSRPRPNFRS